MPKKSKTEKFIGGVHDSAYELTKEDFKKSVRDSDHPVIGGMLKKSHAKRVSLIDALMKMPSAGRDSDFYRKEDN